MSKGRFVPTKANIARRCGISYYRLLQNWDRPGRPKDHSPGSARYDVLAYGNWIGSWKSAHNFGSGHNGESNGYRFNEREKALIERNKIAAESARFDLQVKMGEYVRRLDVNRDRQTANAIVRRELAKMIQSTLPPKVYGLKPAEIAKVGMEELNRVLRYLPGQFAMAASANGNGSQ